MVEKESEDTTDVSFMIFHETKLGIIGNLMNQLIMKSQFRKLINNVLSGFDKYLTSNNRVGKSSKILTSEQVKLKKRRGFWKS
ncbi:MAG: hypothetical protein HeimC2_02720 [Candidatus Heimdallarchaeota archaeon LC_2]|nr:MAG: hypothetical protein HeimC2_02720 [Candidatus Heimdallarchaeota archaeon LC_2]